MPDDFLTHVLNQLSALKDVTSRPTFGGDGLYQGEACFAIAYQGRLFLRVDDGSRSMYTQRGQKPLETGEGQTLRSYYEVPSEVLEDPQQLADWAERAIQAA